MKKVLILSCNSAGGGHLAAAVSIRDALRGYVHVEIADFYRESSGILDVIMGAYPHIVRRVPFVYKFFYDLLELELFDRIVNSFFYARAKSNILPILEKSKPDLVVNVHQYAGRTVLNYLERKGIHTAIWNIILDPITLHRSWVDSRYDMTFVATKEAYDKAARYVPRRKLKFLGVILNPKFYGKKKPAKELRAKHGLSGTAPVVLIAGGGEGVVRYEPIVSSLLKKNLNADIVVICGRNKRMRDALRKYDAHPNMHAFGFIENMDEFLRLASVYVGKAGPTSVAEALLLNVPIVITDYICGQENGNVDYTLKNKVGFFERDGKKAAQIVEGILDKKFKLNAGKDFRIDNNAVFAFRDEVLRYLYGKRKPKNQTLSVTT